MKLYTIKRNTWVRVVDDSISTPPASIPVGTNDIVLVDHVDGMYSFCRNLDGEVVHLAAWTEVEVVTDEQVEAARKEVS